MMKGGFTALDFTNETTVVVTEEKEGDVLVVGIDDVTTNYEEEVAWWIFKVNGAMSELFGSKHSGLHRLGEFSGQKSNCVRPPRPKERGMLRAARPVIRISDIFESSSPKFT